MKKSCNIKIKSITINVVIVIIIIPFVIFEYVLKYYPFYIQE